MKTKLIALAIFGVFLGHLTAQVPQLLNYQGRVTAGGVNFDGTGQFKFALVNGDGSNTYWTNDVTGIGTPGSEPGAAVPLTVTKGLYSVLLGDTTLPNMTAIPATVFTNPDVRLRVWFDDGSNGSQLMTPDQRIAAVGYAIMAGTVPDGAITSEKIAVGAIGPAALGAGTISGNLEACSGQDLGNAIVYIPGRNVQATVGALHEGAHPYELAMVPAGIHILTARLDNGASRSVEINLEAGGNLIANFDFSEEFQQQWFRDADGDGFGDPEVSVMACFEPTAPGGETGGWVLNGDDCDDTDPTIHPAAEEICDGIDNNCNGLIDEGGVCCGNSMLDGSETDVDCGGPECGPCEVGKQCIMDSDCISGNCVDGTCQ